MRLSREGQQPAVVVTRLGYNYEMINMKQASKKIVAFISSFEGFSAKPYIDIAGHATIGFGATYYQDGRKVTMQDAPITKQCALELKEFHIEEKEKVVRRLVKSSINQNQFDALVSWVYNLGEGNLKTSTMLKKINANPNDPTIKTSWVQWNKARNPKTKVLEVSNGLTRRRKEEIAIYFS